MELQLSPFIFSFWPRKPLQHLTTPQDVVALEISINALMKLIDDYAFKIHQSDSKKFQEIHEVVSALNGQIMEASMELIDLEKVWKDLTSEVDILLMY